MNITITDETLTGDTQNRVEVAVINERITVKGLMLSTISTTNIKISLKKL